MSANPVRFGFLGRCRGIALLAALALPLLCCGTPPAFAGDPSRPVKLDIPAQPLESSLRALARQADIQILFSPGIATGINGRAISGEMSARAALVLLLESTSLEYVAQDTDTVVVKERGTPSRRELKQTVEPPKAGEGAVKDEGKPTLEEVVVTAQKRQERLIDVPISIAAVSGDEMQQRQITTLEDLQSAVPDLAYTNTGINKSFEIRGVSNVIGTASLVGLYLDEADVTLGGGGLTQISAATFDLDRVEVLRGPQGTLYGEGSAGGTIRLITKQPNLTELAFDSQVAALFTEGGGPTQRISAVVNVPLVENQVGLRVTGTSNHEGGWIDQPVAGQKHINAQDLTNVRIKGLWQPSAQFSLNAMAIINRSERSTDVSDVDAPTEYTQVFNLAATPRLRNDYNLYNLTMTYDFSSVARLLSSTTYLRVSSDEWNMGFTYQFDQPPSPRHHLYLPFEGVEDSLLTQELRLTSVGSGPWQWTFGGFYRRYNDAVDEPIYYYGVPGPPGAALPQPFPVSVKTLFRSASVFLDTSYRFSERFTLGAGVRDFRDHQDFTNYAADFIDYLNPTRQTGGFSSVDPRVYAQYSLTKDANIYASAAKGFRSGGFNGFGQPAYDPESIWTYELGTKMAFLEGHIYFDTAVFLSRYSNYQNFGFNVATDVSYITDAGSARIKGIEWDWMWHPSTQWRFDVRGDYLNARFTVINAALAAYAPGDPLDLVPRYQFTVSGQRQFSWLGKNGLLRLDYNQQGPQTSRNRNINGPTPWYYGESDVIHMLNLSTSLQLNDNLTVGFVAQNLLNDQGFVNPYGYQASGVRSRPRTFGINFGVTFD